MVWCLNDSAPAKHGAASWWAWDEKRNPPWPVMIGFDPIRELVKAKKFDVGRSLAGEITVDADNR